MYTLKWKYEKVKMKPIIKRNGNNHEVVYNYAENVFLLF